MTPPRDGRVPPTYPQGWPSTQMLQSSAIGSGSAGLLAAPPAPWLLPLPGWVPAPEFADFPLVLLFRIGLPLSHER